VLHCRKVVLYDVNKFCFGRVQSLRGSCMKECLRAWFLKLWYAYHYCYANHCLLIRAWYIKKDNSFKKYIKHEDCWKQCLTQPCCQPVFQSRAFLFKCKTLLHWYCYFSFTVTPPRKFEEFPFLRLRVLHIGRLFKLATSLSVLTRTLNVCIWHFFLPLIREQGCCT